MNNTAIILAAGKGQRFGGKIPKQFSEINGWPLIWYSLRVFKKFDATINILLVLDRDQKNIWEEICNTRKIDISHKIVLGGSSRIESVKNALLEIEGDGIVYIHDAARPCLNIDLLQNVQDGVVKFGNAIPVISEVSALRIKKDNLFSSFERENVVVVQTPQAYRITEIKMAYDHLFDENAKDDAEIAEKFGLTINHVEGDVKNIKVTYSFDLEIANVILGRQENE